MRKDATQVPVDLEALLVRRDFTTDKPIEMGDSLVVPYKRRSVVVAQRRSVVVVATSDEPALLRAVANLRRVD